MKEEQPVKYLTSEREERSDFYATFGSQSPYAQQYVEIIAATFEEAREVMYSAHGPKWAFLYKWEAFKEQPEKYTTCGRSRRSRRTTSATGGANERRSKMKRRSEEPVTVQQEQVIEVTRFRVGRQEFETKQEAEDEKIRLDIGHLVSVVLPSTCDQDQITDFIWEHRQQLHDLLWSVSDVDISGA